MSSVETTSAGAAAANLGATERIDHALTDLDLRSTADILQALHTSQCQALAAVDQARPAIEAAVQAAAQRLSDTSGRLVMLGAGASGRLAVQDGAELWPTFGWPAERLVLAMAGGFEALVTGIEGAEDDVQAAAAEVARHAIDANDVVVAVAASGRSPWTLAWLRASRERGALAIALANNKASPLLLRAEHPVFLDSGPEVLAGSTRMAAGTAQKVALNLFSTTLMVRLNRTYGNLMVDMAAVNQKLDDRRVRLLQGVLPNVSDEQASAALVRSGGWVKLAALVTQGLAPDDARHLLEQHCGSLRASLASLDENHGSRGG